MGFVCERVTRHASRVTYSAPAKVEFFLISANFVLSLFESDSLIPYQMNQYKKLNNLLGRIVFAIAAIGFLLTLEPTASWWDPGEFISTTYKLQVGHPPGAPTMQMIGRIFSLFAFGDTSKVALMINGMSGLCSAFAVLFLFWSITHF